MIFLHATRPSKHSLLNRVSLRPSCIPNAVDQTDYNTHEQTLFPLRCTQPPKTKVIATPSMASSKPVVAPSNTAGPVAAASTSGNMAPNTVRASYNPFNPFAEGFAQQNQPPPPYSSPSTGTSHMQQHDARPKSSSGGSPSNAQYRKTSTVGSPAMPSATAGTNTTDLTNPFLHQDVTPKHSGSTRPTENQLDTGHDYRAVRGSSSPFLRHFF